MHTHTPRLPLSLPLSRPRRSLIAPASVCNRIRDVLRVLRRACRLATWTWGATRAHLMRCVAAFVFISIYIYVCVCVVQMRMCECVDWVSMCLPAVSSLPQRSPRSLVRNRHNNSQQPQALQQQPQPLQQQPQPLQQQPQALQQQPLQALQQQPQALQQQPRVNHGMHTMDTTIAIPAN